ncbi:MAG: AAA family ATPase [Patescibacteria group bacterium]
MIKKIVKIRNFPSFMDFKPATDLSKFAKYNLIYGWNGSGKTCFSRILRSFELGQNFFDISERQSEFEFKLDDGTLISNNDLSVLKNIRVFNKDFIEDSIFCDSGPKPIFFLGKQSKKDKEKITQDEIDLVLLRKDLSSKEMRLNKAKENKDRTLSNKARDIRTALTTPMRDDSYRNYERPTLEDAIKNNSEKLKNISDLKLSAVRIASVKKSILQTSKDKVDTLPIPDLDITELEKEIRIILSKTVISKVIAGLQKDEVISKWVERGLEIYRDKTLNVCAFCDQKIPSSRIKDLENHFNDEYQNMLRSVQELKDKCNLRRVKVEFPESSIFYDDLTVEYLLEKKRGDATVFNFNKLLDSFVAVLEQKEQNLFFQPILDRVGSIDTVAFSNINVIIRRHNQKTSNFEIQIDKDKKDFELHFIAEFLPTYNEVLKENETSQKDYSSSLVAIKQKEEEIKTLKENLISHYIPTQQINKNLQQFLGRNDIQLRASETKNGYQITRNGEIAKNLSEGEKTALAIVYFLARLQEDGFDLKNSIVVIDDPVSSLDSNAIFQAFSFIREFIKDAGQIIILTHHFDFFRQIKRWFLFCNKSDREFFMIVCNSSSGLRNSVIMKIDRLLIEYESEYHFLFSVLYNFIKNNQQELEKLYPMPNIARKFLESFLAFRIPLNLGVTDIHKRLEHIEFDSIKKTRIERFVQTHSHPRYESGVQDFDMTILSETRSIVNDLLELVKTEDERHYNFMLKSITE